MGQKQKINLDGFGTLGILIVLAAALLLGGGFWVYQYQGIPGVKPKPSTPVSPALSTSPQPSPEATGASDWKTYRNEEYNFMITYPVDWSFSVTDYGDSSGIIDIKKNIDDNSIALFKIVVAKRLSVR